MNIIRQRDNFSCGPVAILNLNRHKGWETEPFLKIKKKVRCKTTGTRIGNIMKYYRSTRSMASLRVNFSLRELKKLHSKYGMILFLDYKDGLSGHFVTITKFTKYGAWTTNNCSGIPKFKKLKKLCWLKNSTLKYLIEGAILVK